MQKALTEMNIQLANVIFFQPVGFPPAKESGQGKPAPPSVHEGPMPALGFESQNILPDLAAPPRDLLHGPPRRGAYPKLVAHVSQPHYRCRDSLLAKIQGDVSDGSKNPACRAAIKEPKGRGHAAAPLSCTSV